MNSLTAATALLASSLVCLQQGEVMRLHRLSTTVGYRAQQVGYLEVLLTIFTYVPPAYATRFR